MSIEHEIRVGWRPASRCRLLPCRPTGATANREPPAASHDCFESNADAKGTGHGPGFLALEGRRESYANLGEHGRTGGQTCHATPWVELAPIVSSSQPTRRASRDRSNNRREALTLALAAAECCVRPTRAAEFVSGRAVRRRACRRRVAAGHPQRSPARRRVANRSAEDIRDKERPVLRPQPSCAADRRFHGVDPAIDGEGRARSRSNSRTSAACVPSIAVTIECAGNGRESREPQRLRGQ